MPMSKSEVAGHVKETLKRVPIGKTPADVAAASAFYEFMFTEFPDLRKYFKGAENFNADDVRKSERFNKNSTSLLLVVNLLAQSFENEPVFRAVARELAARHRQFNMDPSLWLAFWTVYVKFLETKGPLTADQKQAWKELGDVFNEECQSHLKDLGLPHC